MPNVMVGGGAQVTSVEPSWMNNCFIKAPTKLLAPSTMWRHSQKTAICGPESKPSPNTESASAWSWTSRLQNSTKWFFCFFISLNNWMKFTLLGVELAWNPSPFLLSYVFLLEWEMRMSVVCLSIMFWKHSWRHISPQDESYLKSHPICLVL